jgi:hypothetical protein
MTQTASKTPAKLVSPVRPSSAPKLVTPIRRTKPPVAPMKPRVTEERRRSGDGPQSGPTKRSSQIAVISPKPRTPRRLQALPCFIRSSPPPRRLSWRGGSDFTTSSCGRQPTGLPVPSPPTLLAPPERTSPVPSGTGPTPRLPSKPERYYALRNTLSPRGKFSTAVKVGPCKRLMCGGPRPPRPHAGASESLRRRWIFSLSRTARGPFKFRVRGRHPAALDSDVRRDPAALFFASAWLKCSAAPIIGCSQPCAEGRQHFSALGPTGSLLRRTK